MTLNEGIQNRDRTLISDTIDKTDEKIYITESNARKLLDWADSFSKMAFDYEKRNSKSKRYSKIRSIVERFDSKIRKSKTKKLSRRSTYMEEDGFNYSLQDRDELDAKHKDLYERYKEGDKEAYEEAVELVEADALQKGFISENGRVKKFRSYSDLPESFKRAYLTSMPQELRNEINSWEYVSKSPYSHSFYNMAGKSWSNTPEGILRISDHWNFHSRGEIHCQTTTPDDNIFKYFARY